MLALLLLLAVAPPSPSMKGPAPGYRAEIEKWRADRVHRLTADDGWLTVIALSWLEEGENGVGSAPSNRIVLPPGKAPANLGTIHLARGAAELTVAGGAAVTHDGKPVTKIALASDAHGGDPTIVRHGTLSLYLIERGGRLGVRVKDSANPPRSRFHGIESYPVKEAWRLPARFDRYEPKKSIPIPNVLGGVTQEPSPGAFVFTVGGKDYRLDAVEEEGEDDLFLIFADRTNGSETYGAGRFLYAKRPGADG
ncbi:MAG TPA: DUF1684 domain-containing protein, partial [Thermoanaerobaculia bacterium]